VKGGDWKQVGRFLQNLEFCDKSGFYCGRKFVKNSKKGIKGGNFLHKYNKGIDRNF